MPNAMNAASCWFMLVAGAATATERPVVDGVFREWAVAEVIVTDPTGDAQGSFDLVESRLQSRGTELFLQLAFASPLNLPDGPTSDADLRLTLRRLPSGPDLAFGFREKLPKVNGVNINWRRVRFASAPTTASDRIEMRIDLAYLGIAVGDTIQLEFSGADLLAPVSFTLVKPAFNQPRQSMTRSTCTDFRVASLNTYQTGLLNTGRAPGLLRLLDAADADVYLFQEEYSSTTTELAALINSVDPKEDAIPWTVVKNGELAIASQWQLLPISLNERHFAALVRVPEGPDVFVINTHPYCCGYSGSPSDQNRVNLATDTIAAVARLRAGTLSPELLPFADAPILIGGDWNLVGSSTPRDLWLTPPTKLSVVPLRHLIGDDRWTWNYFDTQPWHFGNFWPGLLDFFLVQRPHLFPRGGFVLDSRDLNPSELADAGLQADDSSNTDHLLLVVDFGQSPHADFSGDGVVNDDDFQVFISAYDILECTDLAMPDFCPSDLDADGFVDDADFQAFVVAYERLICP